MTVEMTVDTLADVMSFSGTFTLIEDAIQDLESMRLDDGEIAAFLTLPGDMRMKIAARLMGLSEILREALREIEGRVMQVTAEA